MVIPAEAVPGPILLSEDDKAAYMRMRDTLLEATLREYDVFNMENPMRRVSSLDWKLCKTNDGISVYKQRASVSGTRKESPLVPRLLTPEGRYERVEANISVPQMLVTGTMRGSVDDAVYGGFVDGPEAHAKRGFYIDDRSSDFRVLASIETPNEQEPYRFSGLTWTEMGGAGVPFVRRRDLVTLVSSGILTRTHDRIGFYIIHSVSHQHAPPLHDHKLMRAKTSFCYLFRQPHSNHDGYVETFQRGFFAPLGDVPERGVLAAVVRVLSTPTQLVDAAHAKKLCFMLKHAPPSSRRRSSADDEMEIEDQGCAGGCSRSRSDSFFGVASASRPLRKLKQQQNHGVCVLCKLPVCGLCKVVKKLAVDATGYEIVVKSLGFCILCVNKSKTISAALFARQERSENRASTSGPSFTRSDSGLPRSSSGGASVSSVGSASASVSSVTSGVASFNIVASSGKQSPQAQPRRRPPPPPPPQLQERQALYRKDSSPSGGVYLLPQEPPAVPRRRIDERVAIEDIALKGILL